MSRKTPGVYIEEINPFPNSIVPVETAIPTFIGFTEKVHSDWKDLTNIPTRIESLSEFENFFGKGYRTTYNLAVTSSTQEFDFQLNGVSYALEADNGTRFLLYDALKFFYSNGGGSCYIVSVGTFSGIEKNNHFSSITPFTEAIDTLELEDEPSMLVVPDAVLFSSNDCYRLQEYMLMHCGKQKNRIAILDIHEGYKGLDDANFNPIDNFRNNITSNYFSFGTAYYPWLHTKIVEKGKINYKNLNHGGIQTLIGIFENTLSKAKEIKALIASVRLSSATEEEKENEIHKILSASISEYNTVMAAILKKNNILPPSAAMAGVYTSVDNQRGVWKAPANVSVAGVVSPTVEITQKQQEDLNAPSSGKSICGIRSFIGRGTLVWGARTLDGNSTEWRYISVKRTIIMIEQSIKKGIKPFVFEPNEQVTWQSIKSLIENFLVELWKQGALAGATSRQGFFVAVGLGSTMTADDILNEILRIEVGIALTRPAEFTVLKFQEQMLK